MDKILKHILVVDDDDGIRNLIKQYLVSKKFLVTTAVNAKIEPTDRSIPPDKITTVWPAARTATIDTCFNRLVMFINVKKFGDRNETIDPKSNAISTIQVRG